MHKEDVLNLISSTQQEVEKALTDFRNSQNKEELDGKVLLKDLANLIVEGVDTTQNIKSSLFNKLGFSKHKN